MLGAAPTRDDAPAVILDESHSLCPLRHLLQEALPDPDHGQLISSTPPGS